VRYPGSIAKLEK